jgi:hypothetical protein
MRALGWLLQLWRRIEPVERLDWILETLGLRERVHQLVVAVFGGAIMFVVQSLRDAPIDWIALMVLGSAGLIFYLVNQLSAWSAYQNNRKALYQLNPSARPTIAFFTPRRLFACVMTLALAIFSLSLHRGPSGIEWPWSGETAPPPASMLPGQRALDNFYVSFSFPHPAGIAGNDVEIVLRFLNSEENPISVENISVLELFGNDKESYRRLDECYDPNMVDAKIQNDAAFPDDTPTQGSSGTKTLEFVSYKKPITMTLNGTEAKFPLLIPPRMPIIVAVSFEVSPLEKRRGGFNFFVVCPTIKFFDTVGLESIAICPGLIDMSFSKEESRDYWNRLSRLSPSLDHIVTIGPSSSTEDRYRVLAKRAGRFQLAPKVGTNSCPLVTAD